MLRNGPTIDNNREPAPTYARAAVEERTRDTADSARWTRAHHLSSTNARAARVGHEGDPPAHLSQARETPSARPLRFDRGRRDRLTSATRTARATDRAPAGAGMRRRARSRTSTAVQEVEEAVVSRSGDQALRNPSTRERSRDAKPSRADDGETARPARSRTSRRRRRVGSRAADDGRSSSSTWEGVA